MVDPIQLAYDVSGTVVSLGLTPGLWLFLFLLAWDRPDFARSVGLGRWAFFLLLPGSLAATYANLPFVAIGPAYLAVNLSGGLFPLLLAGWLFDKVAPPGLRSFLRFLPVLAGETAALLLLVLFVPNVLLLDLAVVAVAVSVPAGLLLPQRSRPKGPEREGAIRVGALASLVSLALLATFFLSTPIPGFGITEPFPAFLLPPIAVGVLAVVLARPLFGEATGLALPLAFIASALGVLVGADVLREPPLYVVPLAGLYAIGGAGVFDLVYISPLLAVAAACAAHALLGRPFDLRAGGPAAAPAPPIVGRRLFDSLQEGDEGRFGASVQDSSLAAREAAGAARRLSGLPAGDPGRPWEGLPVPSWVAADQASLDRLAQAPAVDGPDAHRALVTAHWLAAVGQSVARHRFATIGSRAAAFAIDLAIVTAPAAAVWAYLAATIPGTLVDVLSSATFVTASYGYAAAAFLYFVLAGELYGTTIGKWLLRIEIRNRAMAPAGFVAYLVREAPKLVSLTVIGIGGAVAMAFLFRGTGVGSGGAGAGVMVAVDLGAVGILLGFVAGAVLLLGAIGAIAALFSSESQRLGDRWAGTWVVRRATSEAPRAPPPVPPPPASPPP